MTLTVSLMTIPRQETVTERAYAGGMPDIAAVGAIAIRDGAVLLIRRGHAPGLGSWSLPGGRVEAGETAEQALAREVAEETGLVVKVGALAGEVLLDGPGDTIYAVRDFFVTPTGGTESAGDDATDLAWVPFADMGKYPLTDGLFETLTSWGVLPQAAGGAVAPLPRIATPDADPSSAYARSQRRLSHPPEAQGGAHERANARTGSPHPGLPTR
jgi:8-oxo-dGTP diphosphatase